MGDTPPELEEFERGWGARHRALVEHHSPGETLTAQSYAEEAAHEQEEQDDESPTTAFRVALVVPEMDPTVPTIRLRSESAAQEEEDRTDFDVLGVLGEGGMGRVVLAFQRSLGREVAIKHVKPEALDVQGNRAKALLEESWMTGRLEHPNIVPVHLLGRDEQGLPLLVMKRIEGVSWGDMLDDPGHSQWKKLKEDRLVANIEVLLSVCNALEFSHSRNIAHRDLKPDNVMIGDFGEVYVTDWGIAVEMPRSGDTLPLPEETKLVGTPGYLAPEMLHGDARFIDQRTDVFLLGSTLHFVLTGKMRNEGRTVEQALLSAARCPAYAYNDRVPPELAAICNRATEKLPAKRFASVREFREALVEFLAHRGSIALSASAQQQLRKLQSQLQRIDERRVTQSDGVALYQVAAACRFGFAEALQAWKDNPEAKEGLRASLEALVRFELFRGQADAARALLDEMDVPPANLRERVEALEAQERQQRGQFVRLALLAKELDLSTGVAARRAMLRMLLVATVLLAVYFIGGTLLGRMPPLSNLRLTTVAGVLTGVLLVGAFVFRKEVQSNTANRRVLGVMLGLAVFAFVHRLVGWKVLMLTPERVLAEDMLALAGMGMTATVAFDLRLWPLPLSFAAAFIAALVAPRWGAIASWIGLLGAIAGANRVWVTDAQKDESKVR